MHWADCASVCVILSYCRHCRHFSLRREATEHITLFVTLNRMCLTPQVRLIDDCLPPRGPRRGGGTAPGTRGHITDKLNGFHPNLIKLEQRASGRWARRRTCCRLLSGLAGPRVGKCRSLVSPTLHCFSHTLSLLALENI